MTPTGYRPTFRRAGIAPVVPGTRFRERPIRHDKRRYKDRWRAEAVFWHLMDVRRVTTRHDKLARNDAPAAALMAVIAL